MSWSPFFFRSQSGADSGGLRDNDVCADCGSATLAHCGSCLLLQEDFGGARGSRGPQSSQGSGSVSHLSFMWRTAPIMGLVSDLSTNISAIYSGSGVLNNAVPFLFIIPDC